MDSLIAAAARALAAGDALGALKRVALRNDPAALALRGIAMAQLDEHPRARELLRRAARAFGAHEALARARCVVAEAEVALAMRDLGGSPRTLAAAAAALAARGDRANAVQAQLIASRRSLLLGRLAEAAAALAAIDAAELPPLLAAAAELAGAELALRSLHTVAARAALARAQAAALQARVPALLHEVAELGAALERPAARCHVDGNERALQLAEVEALQHAGALVVDACRHGLRAGADWRPLARRPLLFTLARALAEAGPEGVDREALIALAFRTRRPDETHRARLRVEIGRLRKLVAGLADIAATPRGFALVPRDGRTVAVLAPPVAGARRTARVAGRWRGMVDVGTGVGARRQPAHRAARAGRARSRGPGAFDRPRAVAALAGAAARRIHDDLVTPCRAAVWLECPGAPNLGAGALRMNSKTTPPNDVHAAEVVREYRFPGVDRVAGVSHDGRHVWAATGARLLAFDPASGEPARALDVPCDAGTAFDGKHLYQIAEARIDKIDPASGRVLASIPAPGGGGDSGLTWAEGSLWVGQYRDRRIHQIDPETGAVRRTIESNRFVTGVTWVDGELWHGTWEGDESELRRVDARSGAVLERLQMPAGANVSGLESDGADLFYCGGGGGVVRAVRRPKRRTP